MMHRSIALNLAQFWHHNGAELSDPSQIVPKQIDDHDVLRTILGAFLQFANQLSIFFGIGSPWPGPLDGPGFHVSYSIDLNEPLRRRAGDDIVTQIEVAGALCRA